VQNRPVEGSATKAPKPTPKIVQRRPDISTPTSTAKAAPTSTKTSEKRPRADDDASLTVPAKRPRASSTNDRQVTPTPQATSSPAPPGKPSAQKSQAQYVTPKKDHKSVSMLRTASTDSHDTTPGRSGTTPAGRSDSKAVTSAPMTAKKSAEISLLAQTSMKQQKSLPAIKSRNKMRSAPPSSIWSAYCKSDHIRTVTYLTRTVLTWRPTMRKISP
jgi:hypothetical protein